MIKAIKKLHNKRGFTLVEMLVAIFIFTLSLAALMTISSRGLKVARQAQQQVTADYLAIEAIEVVRNIRDSAFLKPLGISSWEFVFGNEGCFDTVEKCNFYISESNTVLDTCEKCKVYFNESSFSYFQTRDDIDPGFPSVESGYYRTIEIDKVSTGQILVSVKVSWTGGEVTYTENLFLWQ